jgi:hypothetical protein
LVLLQVSLLPLSEEFGVFQGVKSGLPASSKEYTVV